MISLRWKTAILAAVIGAGVSIDSDTPLIGPYAFVSTAEAVVGRPATPLSYAGVARRTTRRAVGAGAVAAPVVVAPVVVAPVRTCVQAVDPYGRIYTRC